MSPSWKRRVAKLAVIAVSFSVLLMSMIIVPVVAAFTFLALPLHMAIGMAFVLG